jgi:hypothetical protein
VGLRHEEDSEKKKLHLDHKCKRAIVDNGISIQMEILKPARTWEPWQNNASR